MSPKYDQDSNGHYRAITPDIVLLAAQIKRAFIDLRLEYGGSTSRYVSASKDGDFIKAAFVCRDLGEAPTEFVTRQAEEMVDSGRWFTTMLFSPKAVAESRKKLVQKTEDRLGNYRYQIELFKKRLTLYSAELALKDEANPFSPLFRCCTAMGYKLPQIAEMYRDAAKQELSMYPVAREVFGAQVDQL